MIRAAKKTIEQLEKKNNGFACRHR